MNLTILILSVIQYILHNIYDTVLQIKIQIFEHRAMSTVLRSVIQYNWFSKKYEEQC